MGRTFFIIFTFLMVQLHTMNAALAQSCNYSGDSELETQRSECLKKASMAWSCELNRCMTTQESFALRKQFESCTQISEQSARQACFEKIATEQSGVSKGARPKSSGIEAVAAIGSALYAIILGFSMGSATQATGMSCNSKTVMIGAGAAFLVSHFYFKMFAGKDFKKLQESYEKDTKSADSFDAQYKAFEYLKKEQEAVKKIAGQKKMLYTALLAAFGIGTGLAAWETFKMTTPPDYGVGTACMTEEQQKKNEQMKANDGKVQKPGEDGLSDGAEAQNKDLASKNAELGKGMLAGQLWKLGSSPMNIIAGGIGTGISMKLRSIAAQQVEVAEQNIKDIDETMAKFQEQIAGFCPKGRDDYNNPRCYCYNDDKSKNNSRTKSEVCKNLWAKDDQNFFKKAGNYAANSTGERSGCMMIDGKFDADCKCKKFKDNKTGENACYKTFVSTIDGNIGQTLSLPEGKAVLDSITSGGLSSGVLSQGSLDKLAAKVKKARDSMLAGLNNQLKANNQGEIKLNEDALLRNLASQPISKSLAAETKAADLGALSSDAREASPIASDIKAALAASNIKPVNFSGDGKGMNAAGPQQPKFSFNMGEDGGSNNGNTQTLNYMDKDYNYKNNDIVQRDDVSIFDVISNRYSTSGMRRLFGDGQSSEAPSPDAM